MFRSDRSGELGDGGRDATPWMGFDPEFVVASPDVTRATVVVLAGIVVDTGALPGRHPVADDAAPFARRSPESVRLRGGPPAVLAGLIVREDSTVPHTLVTFHAHPDDEAIATAGVMAKAAAEGHRVVLVVATKGEHAGYGHEMLDPGEKMSERRVQETQRAAEILGVARVDFLGYVDSGMMGTPENDADGSFWTADTDEAALRLAKILDEERADVLTIYDDHGGYGHPDHIQVHRVGAQAAKLAATPVVYESTMNRDHIYRLLKERVAAGDTEIPGDIDPDDLPDPNDNTFGSPESVITTTVDVRSFLDVKRAAMVAHGSQIQESSFFLKMPLEAFREGFGYEWFIRRGAPPGTHEDDLFAPLR